MIPEIANGIMYRDSMVVRFEKRAIFPMPFPSREKRLVAIAICGGTPKKIMVGGKMSMAMPTNVPMMTAQKLTAQRIKKLISSIV